MRATNNDLSSFFNFAETESCLWYIVHVFSYLLFIDNNLGDSMVNSSIYYAEHYQNIQWLY